MTSYTAVILSPHLDDAVFSLGSALVAGVLGRVLVINVYSVSCYSLTGDSDLHSVTKRRLAEDQLAMEGLSIDAQYWGFVDTSLKPYYGDEDAYLDPDADPQVDESWPFVRERIAFEFARHPGALFLAPLGIGNHIEHRIVRNCCLPFLDDGRAVAFYEDGAYYRDKSFSRECTQRVGLSHHVSIPGAGYERKKAVMDIYSSQLNDRVHENIRRAYCEYSGENVWSTANVIKSIAQW